MGFLDNLKKRMSTPGADRFSEERFKAAQPKIAAQDRLTQTTDVAPPLLVDIEAEARRRRRRVMMSVSVLLAVLVIAGGTVAGIRYYREAHSVQQKSINLEIAAPESVSSGADVQYRIGLRNDSRVVWQNVVVEAKLPEGYAVKQVDPTPASTTGTIRWAVGTLRPRESSVLAVTGRLVGEEGTSATLTATATLTPENAPGLQVRKSQFVAVRIDRVPVALAVEAPKQAASGERVTIRIAYQNQTTVDLTGARVVVTPPQGFSVESTDPPLTGRDLVWDLPPIPQQGQGTITIIGILQGDPDATRPFKGAIGFVTPDGKFIAQREVQATTTIARRAFTISQVFQDERDILKVNPGEEVNAKIQYKNTGNIGLRDIILKLQFEGRGLNGRRVQASGGFFDSAANSITWSAASVPALKALRPGESGEIPFKFYILQAKDLPFASPEDTNFQLVSRVTGDSPDIPTPVGATKEIISDQFKILVNSVIGLNLAAFYDDGRAGLPVSTGPKQPQVGQESIYTIRVRLTNTSNDVVDAVYRTTLPDGIRWTNNKYTTVGDVVYNERNREVQWNIGAIPARAGAALPGPEFAFQVGLTPSLNQVGSKAALTKGHTLDGTDVFTAARLHAESAAMTTENVDPAHSEVLR